MREDKNKENHLTLGNSTLDRTNEKTPMRSLSRETQDEKRQSERTKLFTSPLLFFSLRIIARTIRGTLKNPSSFKPMLNVKENSF